MSDSPAFPTSEIVVAPTSSPSTVTRDGDTILISGQLSWVPDRGSIDPVRVTTNYQVTMPVAGSPFDPAFTPPPPVRDQPIPPVIGQELPASIENPNARERIDSDPSIAQIVDLDGTPLPWVDGLGEAFNPQPQLTDQYVWFNSIQTVFQGDNGVSGTNTYSLFLNFNDDFTQVTSMAAVIVIESSLFVPIPGEDPITELLRSAYIGFDPFERPVDVADLGGGSGGGPVGQPPGTGAGLTPAEAREVALLYEAGLDRDGAIDLAGLNFWIDEREGGLSIEEVARFFLDSDEFEAAVGDPDTLSDRALVEGLYLNVLDRPGEVAGVEFWTGVAADPAFSRAELLFEFATSVENADTLDFVNTLAEVAPGEWAFAA